MISFTKRILPLLLALMLLVTLPVTAAAAEGNVDLEKTGSITIELRDKADKETAIGGTVRLHKVGDITIRNGNLAFVLTSEFAGSGLSLEDVNAADLPGELLDYAEENEIAGTLVKSNSAGKATFSNLSVGLYLISQKTAVSGYYKVSPFLVVLPMYSNTSGWDYTISAFPKVQPEEEEIDISVRKVWKDNNKKRPAKLVVQLLKDGEVEEEITLTRKNNWKYTWTDLNGSAEWDVKEKTVPEGYKATYSRSGNVITITNKASWYVPPPNILIQTGQLNWPVPVLFGLGLLFLVVGLLVLKKRDRNDYEA